MADSKSIIPPTGDHGLAWPDKFVLPQGKEGAISYGGWTKDNEGFVQQTFLGASIRNFDLNAGFGDTTSSLSVSVVEDEYNKSDRLGHGQGDDVYHNGGRDIFNPPIVGSPVFFKFGKNLADVEQAWRKTFDDTYGYNTLSLPIVFPTTTTTGPITAIPAEHHFLKKKTGTGSSQVNEWEDKSLMYDTVSPDYRRGYAHFVFGGILQSYTQNRGPGGNPAYNISVQDPREILSNATMVLNNYAGTTYNNKNLFNLYGFLEYDISDDLQADIDAGRESKSVLKKSVNITTGEVSYAGIIEDTSIFLDGTVSDYNPDLYKFPDYQSFVISNYPETFPITGQGFARRSDQGIPIYRVFQAMETLFEMKGNLPDEIKEKGFGGAIDFRGFKYVVDWTGIPVEKIPNMYFMDFDQIDMLSFAQELCDIISHDMMVSLLPVIDHPGCQWLHQKNQYHISIGEYSKVIAGIIRIDTIDKSKQPAYGAIKEYLDDLESRDIYVENRDVGYEVSNVTTDKFVVGAQEVEMYYFHNIKDRDNLQLRRHKHGLPNEYEKLQRDQWSLKTALNQQMLPFYGFLGKDALTIPRGWGSYQQIMLDSTGLDAFGVGNYYIATEMELRCAAISYKTWVEFLLMYSERYMSEIGEDQQLTSALTRQLTSDEQDGGGSEDSPAFDAQMAAKEFGVDVPRCVFSSDRNHMGSDGYPASPCSPPFGYPLYYKRAEKIGIPQAGFTEISASRTTMMSNIERVKNLEDRFETQADNNTVLIANLERQKIGASPSLQNSIDKQIKALEDKVSASQAAVTALGGTKSRINNTLNASQHLYKQIDRLGQETIKNAMKVYSFVKKVADEYLGKKFLVKIPKACNVNYDKQISFHTLTTSTSPPMTFLDPTFNVKNGPFGFKPEPVNSGLNHYNSTEFQAELFPLRNTIKPEDVHEHYLDNEKLNPPTPTPMNFRRYNYGALKNNFNPISEKWEFNYKPEPQGGFFNFAIYDKNLSFSEALSVPDSKLAPATQQLLTPKDLTNFISENGRVSCYARYNNSQYLDLSSVGKDSLSQEKLSSAGFIPDIMEDINNQSADKAKNFGAIAKRISQSDPPNPAVAYVKCQVDDKLYMPPRTHSVSTTVYARDVKRIMHDPVFSMIEREVTDPDSDKFGCKELVRSSEFPVVSFEPADDGGADGTQVDNEDFFRRYDAVLDGDIVKTQLEELDSGNVYAIITVPGRIKATQDQRYLDGIVQAINTPRLKSAMTVDVVKGVLGFEKPAGKASSVDPFKLACSNNNFSATEINDAMAEYRENKKGITAGTLERGAGFVSPSPVFPDLVAIPLMSMERCYGPWQSASVQNFTGSTQVRYSNIGGKLEFVKDENLAPWNYAGYQLMNEAGQLQAQFSNSLLLFTERGGFVMPEAPTGISLAKALKSEGPLVTSISVSIGDSIKTTVKMDLYTSRFGKLQKQKENAIGKAARERQKIIDEKNALTRKGMGKGASSANLFGGMKAAFADAVQSIGSTSDAIGDIEKSPDRFIMSANKKLTESMDENGDKTTATNLGADGAMLNKEAYEFAQQAMDFVQQKYADFMSAGGTLGETSKPISFDVFHPGMDTPDQGHFTSDIIA